MSASCPSCEQEIETEDNPFDCPNCGTRLEWEWVEYWVGDEEFAYANLIVTEFGNAHSEERKKNENH